MVRLCRPGIEPASWILVGFITAQPRWELPVCDFLGFGDPCLSRELSSCCVCPLSFQGLKSHVSPRPGWRGCLGSAQRCFSLCFTLESSCCAGLTCSFTVSVLSEVFPVTSRVTFKCSNHHLVLGRFPVSLTTFSFKSLHFGQRLLCTSFRLWFPTLPPA